MSEYNTLRRGTKSHPLEARGFPCGWKGGKVVDNGVSERSLDIKGVVFCC
ncbi:hypothetical protein CCP2SC5_20104 [Azospirillaceae bacterium]